MKFNKWTLGLAALGVVSLASAVKAEEKTFVETAVSGTQISGYVNTSAHWNFNQGNADWVGGSDYANGFNLDAVSVTIAKPLDESEWASGYCFQMVYGQDAYSVGVNNDGNSSIKQAYAALRVPVGNGIDLKVGVWDTILGYESFDSGNNPNYTRSYGYYLETTTYAGVLAAYKFCDVLSMQAGVANSPWQGYALERNETDSRKTYLGSVALTAPQSWGALAGSTLYGAVAYGGGSYDGGYYHENLVNYYVGAVVNTGIKGLKVGAAYDYQGYDVTYGGVGPFNSWDNALALYASFQATDKLSLHGRAEYAWNSSGYGSAHQDIYALTLTAQYDLWKNVLSRLELRWDHSNNTDVISYDSTSDSDAVLLAANIIYKF